MEQRWRYSDDKRRPIWVAFNPDFACIRCDEPVMVLSDGGPAFCSACSRGVGDDGEPWDYRTLQARLAHARRRLNELPTDPIWREYELRYRRQPSWKVAT